MTLALGSSHNLCSKMVLLGGKGNENIIRKIENNCLSVSQLQVCNLILMRVGFSNNMAHFPIITIKQPKQCKKTKCLYIGTCKIILSFTTFVSNSVIGITTDDANAHLLSVRL